MSAKVLIIVPAYNEEKNIVRVVDNLVKNYSQYDYIVVNDGSHDATAEICRKNNYNFLDYPVHLGLAAAFQGGMKYALRKGYEYVLQYDGDGQHKAEYISHLLAVAEHQACDVVIGSRFVTKRKPWTIRMIGSRLIALCIFLTTGQKIHDPTSGMRLYGKKIIKIFTDRINFSPEPDTIAFLIRCGAKVEECQVQMNERTAGESYFDVLNGIQYVFWVCSSVLIAQWFRKRG